MAIDSRKYSDIEQFISKSFGNQENGTKYRKIK